MNINSELSPSKNNRTLYALTPQTTLAPSRPSRAYSPKRIPQNIPHSHKSDDYDDNCTSNYSHHFVAERTPSIDDYTIADELKIFRETSDLYPVRSNPTKLKSPENTPSQLSSINNKYIEYDGSVNNYDKSVHYHSDSLDYSHGNKLGSSISVYNTPADFSLGSKEKNASSISTSTLTQSCYSTDYYDNTFASTSLVSPISHGKYGYKDEKYINMRFANDDNNSSSSNDYDYLVEHDDQNTLLDETPVEYRVPTESQPRRNKETRKKQLKLIQGNLVIDCPIPSKLLSYLPRKDLNEFTHMRYSAITCDANDFSSAGFTLRPVLEGRETELCICITMYNEDAASMCQTLSGVMRNIAHLNSRRKSRVWGKNGWQKIVVCIMADGRFHTHPRVLDCLALMGLYQPGVAKNKVNGKVVTAHLYEYTTQVCIDPSMNYVGAESGLVPVQMVFCLKEQNTRKINSHRWLFNGFCPSLDPNVCILLDVGTKPGPSSIYQLWKAFDENSNVGGACGEIKVMKGTHWKQLLTNPLVAAQNFEYKISNILDKPFESVFGYITVLPGALSAYRYKAIKNHAEDGTGPLNSYFKCENYPNTIAVPNGGSARNPVKASATYNIFERNMYLAEDRILCWELVAKRGEKWILKYVKAATGETDVPTTLSEFIVQRRRWLNGAFFAAIYSQMHVYRLLKTDHSYARKFLLFVEFFYQLINLSFQFLSLANFYIIVYYISGSMQSPIWDIFFYIFQYLCLMVIGSQFVISLGNRPQGAKQLFLISMIIFALITTYTTICALYFVLSKIFLSHDSENSPLNTPLLSLIISLISTYGLYVLMSIIYLDPWHLITSGIQYFLFLPGYICTLQIHAFCNVHDITWGTKGNDNAMSDLGAASAVTTPDSKTIMVELEVPAEQTDINYDYNVSLAKLRQYSLEIGHGEPESFAVVEGSQDHYHMIRSRLVLAWMAVNYFLVQIITNLVERMESNNGYLYVIMWLVAIMGSLRLVGSLSYLVLRCFEYVYRGWVAFRFMNKKSCK